MPAPLDQLLPHRPPMQWVRELTACTETTATARARLDAGDFPVAEGGVLESALVECVAQTAAAAAGERARAAGGGGATQGGMLVAVAGFKIQARPGAGQELTIAIEERRRLGPMRLIWGEVSCDGRVIASGELTVYA